MKEEIERGCIIITSEAPFGEVYYWDSDEKIVLSQRLFGLKISKEYDSKFIYYYMRTHNFQEELRGRATGTTVIGLRQPELLKCHISLPPLEEQRRIAGILGAIDDKIENNRRINDNLEQQAQTLFDEWFVNDSTQPAEYNRASLTDIANYLNGLAMQRFRPQSDEKAIPVLKIKELGQGMCDSSSDICSQSIDSKYIVNDGDIIFSWSGTLLVDIWCGGICGLNQHLFKVTSDKYPKWFVYYWTKYHLAKFIRIAKDKAVTMGHIKRGDLETSEVLIPNAEILSKMDNIIAPIFDAIISRRVENKNLATLRDTLLPKLMNGEIKL
jgi:type I restriction enzyme S subunit